MIGLPGCRARGQQYAGQPGNAARDHVHEDPNPGEIDAGQAGSGGVAADGVNGPAEVGIGHEDVDQDRHDHQDHRQDRDAGPLAATERTDGCIGQEAALGQPGEIGLGEHADRFAIRRQQESEACKRGQCAEGGDDWVDAQLGDDQAVDCTSDHAGHDSCGNCNDHVAGGQNMKRANRSRADQDRGSHHRADRSNRADRNVERAGDDHHRLANRQQADDHDGLGQAVHQVLPGEELVRHRPFRTSR